MNLTDAWKQYQTGLDFQRKINLQPNVDTNERFYAGDQWKGVTSNGLPTPVFNVIKRIVQYKVAALKPTDVKIRYYIEGIADDTEDEEEIKLKEVAELFSKFSNTQWERLKMDTMNLNSLKDGALTGDYIDYFYFNPEIETGEEAKGDLDLDQVDNLNIMLGNPNLPPDKIQKQPYIEIAYRDMVENVRKEAKNNKIPQNLIDLITSDTETENQAGDRAKIELDDNNKCIILLKLWKKDGTVWYKKSTRYTDVTKEINTNLKRYPVAMGNWETRKNSSHGTAEVTGLIPNQVFINKLFAMAMMSAMYYAFPKPVYDVNSIDGDFPTAIGEAIKVNNNTGGSIKNVADFLNPGQMSVDVPKLIEFTISYTKEMCGASETALGEVDPKNTSAIIAVKEAAGVPLETIKDRFNQFIEDIALIWIDMWTTYYNTERNITIYENGVKQIVRINPSEYKDKLWKVKIDVSPGGKWGEIENRQTLDNLLQQEQITFLEWLERQSDDVIPDREGLIEAREGQDTDRAIIQELIAQFIEKLPPQVQDIIMQNPDAYEEQIKQVLPYQDDPDAVNQFIQSIGGVQ